MSTSTSIRINQTLYNQARSEAACEHRTIAGQIEYWAKVGRAALDNPELHLQVGSCLHQFVAFLVLGFSKEP